MQTKLRVGVVGVGSLGQWHARVYSELAHVELVGVYDPQAERAREIAQRYGARAFDSLSALAAEIDAASVAAPTDRHHDLFFELAEHGCHQLVEKPIASTTEQAERMVAAAEHKGLILQVGHVERFNPVMRFLEDRLSAPRFIEAIRLAPFPPPRAEAPPRGTEVSVVLDLMIHDIDVILHLVRAPVASVHAVGVAVLAPSVDIANVRLTFANGCVANLTASRISRERMRKIRVFQEDSYLSLDYMNQSGQLSRKRGDNIETVPVPIEKGDALEHELDSFIDSVRQAGEPVVSGRQASIALKLAVRIGRTIAENPC